jgi:hypothetical protein
MKLIEDRKITLAKQLRHMQARMYYLRLAANLIECQYKEKKQEYEALDKERALIDGRLRKIKVEAKAPKPPKQLSQEELLDLIKELEDML